MNSTSHRNAWEDPRKLERWWGSPTYPATFTRYEFEPGGQCRYYMTGPEDLKHHGWWRIESIDEPHRVEFTLGLSGDDGGRCPRRVRRAASLPSSASAQEPG